jgi:hypothetical protein
VFCELDDAKRRSLGLALRRTQEEGEKTVEKIGKSINGTGAALLKYCNILAPCQQAS